MKWIDSRNAPIDKGAVVKHTVAGVTTVSRVIRRSNDGWVWMYLKTKTGLNEFPVEMNKVEVVPETRLPKRQELTPAEFKTHGIKSYKLGHSVHFFLGVPSTRQRPTKNHKRALFTGVLGTAYGIKPDGTSTKYFDYDWDGAIEYAGILNHGKYQDPRVSRETGAPNHLPDSPRIGQQVLWVTEPKVKNISEAMRAVGMSWKTIKAIRAGYAGLLWNRPLEVFALEHHGKDILTKTKMVYQGRDYKSWDDQLGKSAIGLERIFKLFTVISQNTNRKFNGYT